VLVYAYSLSKKAARFSQDENKLFEESNRVMEDAMQKAKRILQESIDKAKKMLAQTDYFQRELERESRNAFLQTSHRYAELFEKELKSLTQSYKDLLVKVEELSLEEVKKSMGDQKQTAQYYLQKKVDEEFEKARKEIEDYKSYERGKIEGKIDEIIKNTAKDVIHSSLSAQQQKELIMEMLEKAKADGLFN
jgi:hypothetical protein